MSGHTKDARFANIDHITPEIWEAPEIAVDTETYYDPDAKNTLLKFINDTPQNLPFCITFSDGVRGWKLPVNSKTLPEIIEFFDGPFKPTLIMFNADYDIHMLRNAGCKLPQCKVVDVSFLHHLLNEEDKDANGKYVRSLKALSVKYLDKEADKFEKWVDEARQEIAKQRTIPKEEVSYRDVDDYYPDLMTDYASSDTLYTMQLYRLWAPLIAAEGLERVCAEEHACMWAVIDIERTGMMVDEERVTALRRELEQEIERTTSALYSMVGEFNINSSDQLVEKLQGMGVDYHWKTEKGEWSTDATTLEFLLSDENEAVRDFIQAVLDYRDSDKLLNTFVVGLERYNQNGRIHPSFWQMGTVTGRMSSSTPNFQNYPKSDNRIRKCFIPTPGYIFGYWDYSAQEYNLLGHYAKDENYRQFIVEGKDIHKATAAMMFNVPYEEVTKEQRSRGKTGNFA